MKIVLSKRWRDSAIALCLIHFMGVFLLLWLTYFSRHSLSAVLLYAVLLLPFTAFLFGSLYYTRNFYIKIFAEKTQIISTLWGKKLCLIDCFQPVYYKKIHEDPTRLISLVTNYIIVSNYPIIDEGGKRWLYAFDKKQQIIIPWTDNIQTFLNMDGWIIQDVDF